MAYKSYNSTKSVEFDGIKLVQNDRVSKRDCFKFEKVKQ